MTEGHARLEATFPEHKWQRLAASVILHALIDAVDQPINNKPTDYFERMRRLSRVQARAWILADGPHIGSVRWWCAMSGLLITPEALREKLEDFDAGRDAIADYARRLGWARNIWGRHDNKPD